MARGSRARAARAGSGDGAILAAVLLVAVAVYLNTLGNGFAWDDQELLARAHDWRTTWRPVKRLSILLDRALHADRPAGYHLTNALLHGLASALVAALALRFPRGRQAALAAGLLFAVHPLHVEAVASVAHRKEMLALLWLAVSLLAARAARTRPWWWCLVVASYLLALGSKEAAGVMAPFLILLDGLREGRWKPGALARGAALAVLAAGVAALPWLHPVNRYFETGYLERLSEGRALGYGPLFLTAVAALGWDLEVFLLPHPLYLDRSFPVARGPLDARVLLGVASVVALGALAALLRRRRDVLFGLGWYAVSLAPVSGFLPLSHWLVAERFLYVPSAGLCLALGAWAAPWLAAWPAPRARVAGSALLLVVGALGALSVRQNRVWRDDRTLWEHTLRYNPASYRGRRGLGEYLMGQGDHRGAQASLRAALQLRPQSGSTHFALARSLEASGRPQEALPHARAAVQARGKASGPWLLLARVLDGAGDAEGAARAYREALSRDPTSSTARYEVGRLAWLGGRREEALEELRRLREQAPRHAGAAALLGLIELYSGNADGAERLLAEAIALDPSAAAPHRHLAALYLIRGERERAREHLEAAHRLDPRLPAAEQVLEQVPAGRRP